MFMILEWQLTRIVISPLKNAGLMLVLYSLIEIVSIIIILRFCGPRNIGRDINEFNMYALLLHIITIPTYYYTDIPAEYHSNGIWALFIASLVRLSYFGKIDESGDYKGLPAFGLFAKVQKLYSAHVKKDRRAFQHWPDILFFGSALPLWFIMWKTNDQSITITVIGLMLFIYFITDSIKQKDTQKIDKLGQSGLSGAPAIQPIAQDYDAISQHRGALDNNISENIPATKITAKTFFKTLFFVVLAVCLFFYLMVSVDNGRAALQKGSFDLGYASGFSDAKSGSAPKRETDFNKAMWCINTSGDTPPPPGFACFNR
jgi:hypothetical protein